MKKAVTFRFDATLLEDARRCAAQEGRSLTNFIETLAKTHVASRIGGAAMPADSQFAIQPPRQIR